MEEETLKLLADLHIRNHRQGPGSEQAFRQALQLSGIDTNARLSIADIGCGTGSATIPLLQQTNAAITAVELLPSFLEELAKHAEKLGLRNRLTTLEADMANLPFNEGQFDVIWSEGAIYNIGFAKGVKEWRRFLKPGGVLSVSEITWLSSNVPEPIRAYWDRECPEIATASEKLRILEESGYVPIGYFVLPPDCWLDEYYLPLQEGFADFLTRHNNSEAAKAIVEADQREIELYKKYKDFYSYGFYIARKAAELL